MTMPYETQSLFINPIFFETGTQKGVACRFAIKLGVERIYTIEMRPLPGVLEALKKDCDAAGVEFVYEIGSSSEKMRELLQKAGSVLPKTFWLDAHGDGWLYFGKNCPLLEELDAIAAVPWVVGSVVLIDDMRIIKPDQKKLLDQKLTALGFKDLGRVRGCTYDDIMVVGR